MVVYELFEVDFVMGVVVVFDMCFGVCVCECCFV